MSRQRVEWAREHCFACTYCDAEPNEPCRDDDGNPQEPHVERLRAAQHYNRRSDPA